MVSLTKIILGTGIAWGALGLGISQKLNCDCAMEKNCVRAERLHDYSITSMLTGIVGFTAGVIGSVGYISSKDDKNYKD